MALWGRARNFLPVPTRLRRVARSNGAAIRTLGHSRRQFPAAFGQPVVAGLVLCRRPDFRILRDHPDSHTPQNETSGGKGPGPRFPSAVVFHAEHDQPAIHVQEGANRVEEIARQPVRGPLELQPKSLFLPLVAMRGQLGLADGAVRRVPPLGADAVVQGEEGLVVGNRNVAEARPGEDVDGRMSSQ